MARPTAVDLEAFAPSIQRFACILSLASLVPVIFAGRFGAAASRRFQDRQQPPASSKEAVATGLGLGCLLLLLASEALGCWDVLQPLAGARGKAGKFQALLDGIKKGMKENKSNKGASHAGFIDTILTVAVMAFGSGGAFEAAHSVAMVAGLCIVLVSTLMRSIPSLLGGRSGARTLMTSVGVVWPSVLFVYFNQKSVGKAFGAVSGGEGLPAGLRLALRVAALFAAAQPAGEADPESSDGDSSGQSGGTPALFAALQAASLVASLSAELVTGSFSGGIVAAQKSGFSIALLSNPLLTTTLFPSILALIWLVVSHLQRNLGALILSSLLCAATSPAVLAFGLPAMQQRLGLTAAQVGPGMLMEFSSVSFLGTAAMVVVAGGTQSLIVVMMFAQLLTKIYGTDVLMEVFA